MSVSIPQHMMDLLERPIVVTLATVMPDGAPQASPVWFSWDGENICINTARGRAKDRNMSRRGVVSVLSIDPDNPYRYLELRGEVAEIVEDGAREHIDELSHRYEGRPYFTHGDTAAKSRQTRVMYKIRPTRVISHE
jgi:PPOX class probable F420-dependent enzyme